MTVAFEMVGKPQTPSVTLDKHGLNGVQMMEVVMAKVIEFYVPDSLLRKVIYTASSDRGKLIEFPSPKEDRPSSNSLQQPEMNALYIAPFAVNFANGQTGDTI